MHDLKVEHGTSDCDATAALLNTALDAALPGDGTFAGCQITTPTTSPTTSTTPTTSVTTTPVRGRFTCEAYNGAVYYGIEADENAEVQLTTLNGLIAACEIASPASTSGTRSFIGPARVQTGGR